MFRRKCRYVIQFHLPPPAVSLSPPAPTRPLPPAPAPRPRPIPPASAPGPRLPVCPVLLRPPCTAVAPDKPPRPTHTAWMPRSCTWNYDMNAASTPYDLVGTVLK